MVQTNTGSIRVWACEAQWHFSQSAVSKARQSISKKIWTPMTFSPLSRNTKSDECTDSSTINTRFSIQKRNESFGYSETENSISSTGSPSKPRTVQVWVPQFHEHDWVKAFCEGAVKEIITLGGAVIKEQPTIPGPMILPAPGAPAQPATKFDVVVPLAPAARIRETIVVPTVPLGIHCDQA